MPISLIPFAGGIQGGIDPRLLPDGALSDAVNCELDRQGRLIGRAGFTASGTGVLSTGAGALVAYDLVNYQGRLFALGDDTRLSVPANLYEYLGSGVAQPWRPTSPVADAVPRLGQATRARDICRPPDQTNGAEIVTGAALGGFAALGWDVSNSYLLIQRADGEKASFFAKLATSASQPCRRLRLLALSDRFLIVGCQSGSTRIGVSKFAPATDTAVSNLATDIFAAAPDGNYGTCKVDSVDQFMLVARVGFSGVKVRRLDNAASVLTPSGGQYADIAENTTSITVEASSSANQVNVACIVSGECRVYSYNLSTGAAIGSGPFVPFSGDTCTDVTLVRVSATQVQVICSVTSGTAPEVKTNLYTVSTNTFAGVVTAVTDAQLTTHARYHAATGAILFGLRVGLGTVGNTPNILASWFSGTNGSRLEIVKDLETAGVPDDSGAAHPPLSDLALDSSTGKYYWCNASADADGTLAPRLTEFKFGSTDRRQMVEFCGHLYIAGGAPMVFDGLSVVESGFQERPRIISLTASNDIGELINSAAYDYRAHWEWTDSKGDLHLSPPSKITTVTLGAADDTVTVVFTSPHSWRRNLGSAPDGGITAVLSRTLADAGPPIIKGENFQRTASSHTSGTAAVAAYLSRLETRKDQSNPIVDTDLIRQQVLYSQGIAAGAHHAPPPGDYLAAGRDRLHVSGQPKRFRATASKILVAAEPAEFAFEGFLQYQTQLGEDILATHVLGDSVLHWTRRSLWEVTGSGPNRGGDGEFFAARRVSNAGGLIDEDGWRSMCETDRGLFYQESATRLVELSKGGTVQWTGRPVQEYLTLYPVITASVNLQARHSVAFSVTNAAGNAGGILRYDLENNAWFFDDVGAVTSLTEYQNRLVYLQGGLVYLENETKGTGTFVAYSLSTGMFQGFQALGWGQVNEVGFLGTFRGNCTVTISASVNGTTFSEALASWSLSSTEYAVGDRVTLLKPPKKQMRDSFALKYAVTGTTNSEGVWLHAAALDTEKAPHFSRQGAAHRAA